MSLKDARTEAKDALARIAKGGDPLREKQAERAQLQRAGTVKAFATLYIERHAKPHRTGSWKEDERRVEKYIVPHLGHRQLLDVRRTDVQSLHATIGTTAAVEANRVVQLLRSMFNKAAAWGHLPADAENPAIMDRAGDRGVKAFKERSRERWVTRLEMPRLLRAISEEENVYVRAAFRLFLLVPLRRRELLRAEWRDIDFDAREWRVPKQKGGGSHTVPLSEPAIDVLRSLPRVLGNPHVFPGHRRGSHLTNINGNWTAVRARAGLEDITLHDLRRSVASWMASSGVSLQVIGQVLGHAPGDLKATSIYARLQRDAAREALDAHAEALLAVEHGNGRRTATTLEAQIRKLLDEKPSDLADRLRQLATSLEAGHE
jgi:integrase